MAKIKRRPALTERRTGDPVRNAEPQQDINSIAEHLRRQLDAALKDRPAPAYPGRERPEELKPS